MATMNPPWLLLLDEHTAALDPGTAEKVLELTKRIVAEGNITCLMVTHNMQQASRISDRTALLLNGDLIEYDRTEEMFLRPTEKITDDYLNGRFV